jgi:hypothetical protein
MTQIYGFAGSIEERGSSLKSELSDIFMNLDIYPELARPLYSQPNINSNGYVYTHFRGCASPRIFFQSVAVLG